GPGGLRDHPAAEADIGQNITHDGGDGRGDHKGDAHNGVHDNGQAEDQGLVDVKDGAGQRQLGDGTVVLPLGEEEDGDDQAAGDAGAGGNGEAVLEGRIQDVRDGFTGQISFR